MARKEKTPKVKTPRKEMSEEKKALYLKIGGLSLAVVAIISLLACVSYLFTWKTDQSLLSDPQMMAPTTDVANPLGKLGFHIGHLLVERFLGLGVFAILGYLFFAAWHMFFRTKPEHLAKKTLLVFAGAVLVSTICSFFGQLFTPDTAFGGGFGGYVGSGLVTSMNNFVGKIGSALILSLCTVIWLTFTNRRFAKWLSGAFETKVDSTPEPEDEGEDLAPAQVANPVAAQFAEEPQHEEISLDEPAVSDEVTELVEDDSEVETETVPAAEAPAAAVETVAPDDSLTIVEGDDFTENVDELERIDVRAELENYKFPSVDLLADYSDQIRTVSRFEIETNNNRIRTTLESYKILVESVTAIVGPTVTLYKVKLAPGMKSAAVKNVEKDIAMALGNESVRVTTLADAVGIEVANETKSMVPLKAMFNDDSFRESKAELPIALGYTITQKVKTFDLADAPHLLVAGATKQGKSVGLNVIVASLLYSKHPSELKFVFVDPKMVEFTPYKRLIHHYLAAMPQAISEEDEMENVIVKDHVKADEILRSLCIEMDDRYLLLSKAGVNKLKDYNEKYSNRYLRPDQGHRFLPYLVVVIDEYADLIMAAASGAKSTSKSVTSSIIRLAQKGRAAGIHVIIATQRPTVDVITGLIKANFPTRIAFRVISRTDSGTILDAPGAEKLIGRGDMLYYEGIKMERVQCAYIDTKEIDAITRFIGDQKGFRQHCNTPYYLPELPADSGEGGEPGASMIDMHKIDSNFEDAARLVVTTQKGSTSDIQRRLGMGYARAGKVMDQLEAAGIVGPQDGSKPRQVLVQSLDELQPILDAFCNK